MREIERKCRDRDAEAPTAAFTLSRELGVLWLGLAVLALLGVWRLRHRQAG